LTANFLITARNRAGTIISYFGAFQQLERPNLLLFTLEAPEHFPGVSLVTIDLKAAKTGCELNLPKPVSSPSWWKTAG
jgi:hypothetical protein